MGYPIQHIVGFDGQTYDLGGGGTIVKNKVEVNIDMNLTGGTFNKLPDGNEAYSVILEEGNWEDSLVNGTSMSIAELVDFLSVYFRGNIGNQDVSLNITFHNVPSGHNAVETLSFSDGTKSFELKNDSPVDTFWNMYGVTIMYASALYSGKVEVKPTIDQSKASQLTLSELHISNPFYLDEIDSTIATLGIKPPIVELYLSATSPTVLTTREDGNPIDTLPIGTLVMLPKVNYVDPIYIGINSGSNVVLIAAESIYDKNNVNATTYSYTNGFFGVITDIITQAPSKAVVKRLDQDCMHWPTSLTSLSHFIPNASAESEETLYNAMHELGDVISEDSSLEAESLYINSLDGNNTYDYESIDVFKYANGHEAIVIKLTVDPEESLEFSGYYISDRFWSVGFYSSSPHGKVVKLETTATTVKFPANAKCKQYIVLFNNPC